MSIKTYENEEQADRNKGKSVWSGKIIKGTLYDAQTKSRVSSIPNKNQNIVYASTSRFVFGNSSERNLTQPKATTAVGPGSYNSDNKPMKVQSKKGTGFFASRSKIQTLLKQKTHIPGPGSYTNTGTNQSLSRSRKKSSSTANINSKISAHQLFKLQLQSSKSKPGVGLYNLSGQAVDKFRSASFFKSKIDRFKDQQIRSPPIGTYELTSSERNSLNRPKKFKSVQQQDNSERNMHKKIQNTLKLFNKKQADPLGPGSYNVQSSQPVGKGFKIKQSIYDRFGDLKPIYAMVKSLQNEGNKIFHAEPKKSKPLASTGGLYPFSSTTKKWEIKLTNQMDPGAYNSSKSPEKQSHLVNFQQKWV